MIDDVFVVTLHPRQKTKLECLGHALLALTPDSWRTIVGIRAKGQR